MKLLPYPELTALQNCLYRRQLGDIVLDARCEAYSFTPTADDKRLARDWEERSNGTPTAPQHVPSVEPAPLTLPASAGAAVTVPPAASGGSGGTSVGDDYAPDPLAAV